MLGDELSKGALGHGGGRRTVRRVARWPRCGRRNGRHTLARVRTRLGRPGVAVETVPRGRGTQFEVEVVLDEREGRVRVQHVVGGGGAVAAGADGHAAVAGGAVDDARHQWTSYAAAARVAASRVRRTDCFIITGMTNYFI